MTTSAVRAVERAVTAATRQSDGPLLDELRKRRGVLAADIAKGRIRTLDEYRYQAGRLAGLDEAITVIQSQKAATA